MARMFSEEQIAMANSVDIASFLQMQGEALIKSGKDMRWAFMIGKQKQVVIQ